MEQTVRLQQESISKEVKIKEIKLERDNYKQSVQDALSQNKLDEELENELEDLKTKVKKLEQDKFTRDLRILDISLSHYGDVPIFTIIESLNNILTFDVELGINDKNKSDEEKLDFLTNFIIDFYQKNKKSKLRLTHYTSEVVLDYIGEKSLFEEYHYDDPETNFYIDKLTQYDGKSGLFFKLVEYDDDLPF